MQEASFSGFFKTIIYMIGFYYLVKILARIFMPILMRKVMNKAQDNFNRQYQQGNFNQGFDTRSQEPERTTRDFKKPTKQVGDYVDYEEVND
ncbi:DUF4834 family protein [Flavobacterium amnicola]|uniref:DUF4834 family protein n=1 Tax=Flavobacterium amnicola TaxID=2506422 RepID=A0A4V1N1Z2_9FLAO|nr:DUF4834 family protein [Flavobacterium amnicola]RXR19198.1 DUF4834 family protein [Flavobacterium amnicola]